LKKISDISELLKVFTELKAMVIGDVMIDSYIFGKVERISPEAPVPVVHINRREMRPGGAANVAINLEALGASTVLCSVTGNDESGEKFNSLLKAEGLGDHGILRSNAHTTTVKTRVIGNNHQLIRVDDETLKDLSGTDETEFISHCLAIIKNEKPNVIIFEDYDKGVITEKLISAITGYASDAGIPVTVDPKRKNFNAYRNITLFKPNLHELQTGLGVSIEKADITTLKTVVSGILKERNMEMVMVTLSEAGVFIATKSETALFPAHVRTISDVSGAGDTVISVASLCLAAGLAPSAIAKLSNLAGGLVCEQVGVVPVDKEKLKAEVEKNPAIIN